MTSWYAGFLLTAVCLVSYVCVTGLAQAWQYAHWSTEAEYDGMLFVCLCPSFLAFLCRER